MSVPTRIARLGQALVKQGLIDAMQLTSALASADQWGMRLPAVLIRMRFVHERAVTDAIAVATGIQTVELHTLPHDPAAQQIVDADFCQLQAVFPFAVRDKGRTVFLAMADPTDMESMDVVAARSNGRVRAFVAPESVIMKAIDRYYRGQDVSLVPEPDEQTIDEIDEMKLVDASGKTMHGVMAPVISLREEAAKEVPGMSPSERMQQRFAGAQPAAPDTMSAAYQQQLLSQQVAGLQAQLAQVEQTTAALLKAQEVNTSLVRALAEILIEKRYLTAEEVRARMARRK